MTQIYVSRSPQRDGVCVAGSGYTLKRQGDRTGLSSRRRAVSRHSGEQSQPRGKVVTQSPPTLHPYTVSSCSSTEATKSNTVYLLLPRLDWQSTICSFDFHHIDTEGVGPYLPPSLLTSTASIASKRWTPQHPTSSC